MDAYKCPTCSRIHDGDADMIAKVGRRQERIDLSGKCCGRAGSARATGGLSVLRASGREHDKRSERCQGESWDRYLPARHAAHAITAVALTLLGIAFAGCGASGDRPRDDAFVVLLPTDVLQLDPRRVSDAYGLKVSRLLFGSLVTIDPHTLDVVPDLAERVTVVSPTVYRVLLREGLRFSDGSTLDAADVIATYESVADPATRSPHARNYARVQSVVAITPRTVEFTLREPHATFLTDLELPIVRAEDRNAVLGTKDGPLPICSGPYVLTRRATGSLSLSANTHWYAGRPAHPRVRFVVVRDDNTRALRMLAGAGDVALNSIPPLLVPLFEGDSRFRVESVDGVGTTYLGFNTESPKLQDVAVRQAIAFALDRAAIVESKFHGRAHVARGFLPSAHWAHDNDVATYQHDVRRANAMLDAAGVRDPDGDGPRPRMTLMLRTSSDRFRQSIGRALAAQLRDVGIEVDVRPSELATLLADLNAGRFELTTLQIPEVFEPHTLSSFFASDRIPGRGTGQGANRFRYANARFDALLERGRSVNDRHERLAAYHEAQQILAHDLPALPLWHEDVVAITRRTEKQMRVPRDGRFAFLAR